MKRKLTPQEKKQLSYERDRRNAYGENDKGSRKTIPLRKRIVARSYRRSTKQQLPHGLVVAPTDDLDAAEARVRSVRRSNWKKWPDIPLGEFIARQHRWRGIRAGRKQRGRDADAAP